MADERSSSDSSAVDCPATSSRRGVLSSVGTCVGVAALAGCTAVDDAPDYERRQVDDVEGEERTAEETTAAEAVVQREPAESVTPLSGLFVEDHQFVLEDDYRGSTVQGTVRNERTDPLQLVEVRVRVFDDADTHLGRYLARTGDLEDGSSWSFEVVLLESPADVGAYDVAVLGIPA